MRRGIGLVAAIVRARPFRHFVFVLAVAGLVIVLDQGARPLAEASLTGYRVPLLGGRIVLERLDDPASASTLAVLKFHLAVALGALLLMTLLASFMGWYGISLLAAFGLILGGAESNHLSLLAFGFVLNWIGYRIDGGTSGPVLVMAPADIVQMAGLAVVTSALTLFTAVTVGQVLPDGWTNWLTDSLSPSTVLREPSGGTGPGPADWDRRMLKSQR